jgi:hypothetical protein
MPSSPCLQTLQRELADSIIRCAPLDDIRILLACGAKVNEPVTQGIKPLSHSSFFISDSLFMLPLIVIRAQTFTLRNVSEVHGGR